MNYQDFHGTRTAQRAKRNDRRPCTMSLSRITRNRRAVTPQNSPSIFGTVVFSTNLPLP
jgi:hypothetical protein